MLSKATRDSSYSDNRGTPVAHPAQTCDLSTKAAHEWPQIPAKDRILSTSEQEQIEGRVRTALDELGIVGWEWIEIDPHFGDTADFCQQYGYDLPHAANAIIVASKRGPAAYCAGIVRGLRPSGCEQAGAGADGSVRGRPSPRRRKLAR